MPDCYKTTWVAFSNASTMSKASVVFHRLGGGLPQQSAPIEIASYHKGGYRAEFTQDFDARNWHEAVFRLIQSAQSIGNGWQILGKIENELDLWTNKVSVVGVTSLGVTMKREHLG